MRASLIRLAAAVILGLVLGAALTTAGIGSQLDNLTLANKSLRDDLAEAQRSLQKLKETSENQKKQTISGLEVFLLLDAREDLTDYDKMAVEFEAGKKVKEWLNPVIGQDVSQLDGLLIPRIVDSREIEANGNLYRLRTYLVVVNRRTSVYIKAGRVNRTELIN